MGGAQLSKADRSEGWSVGRARVDGGVLLARFLDQEGEFYNLQGEKRGWVEGGDEGAMKNFLDKKLALSPPP